MLLPLIAVACYVIGAAWLAIATYQHRSQLQSAQGRGGRSAAVAIACVGVLVHTLALLQERQIAPGAALSLSDTLALVGLTIAITAILMSLRPGKRVSTSHATGSAPRGGRSAVASTATTSDGTSRG